MQALIRDYNGEQFVYVPVKYKNKRFETASGEIISETNIIDVLRDNRSQYVICSYCGAMIKNTPEAIEAHIKEKEQQRDCFKCSHMKTGCSLKGSHKKTFKPDPNNPGNYIVKETWSTNCYCGFIWRSPDINSEVAEAECKYHQCRNAAMENFTDTFLKYPGLFNVLPTVDMLLQKRWKFEGISGDYIIYHHSRMTTLKAYANSKGIVSHFGIQGLSGSFYRLMYSKKYDKLFNFGGNSKYKTSLPYNLTAEKRDSALAKIKELF